MASKIYINTQKNVTTNIIDDKIDVFEYFNMINNGTDEYNNYINSARLFGKGHKLYNDIKRNYLPAFIPNFLFNNQLNNNNIIQATGLFYLDIDNIALEDLSIIKNNIIGNEIVFATWYSLSNKGLSILIKVENLTADNYNQFAKYFKLLFNKSDALLNKYELDNNTFLITQKIALSRDEEIYINDNCKIITYTEVQNFLKENSKSEIKNKVHLGSLISEKNSIGYLNTPSPPLSNNSKSLNNNQIILNNTQQFIAEDEQYIFFKEGVEVIDLYIPKNLIIKEGKRASTLFTFACKLVSLNPDVESSAIFNLLKTIKNKHCENASTVTDIELKKILKSAYKNADPRKIKKKKRKMIFNKNCGLTKKEKLSISAKNIAELKYENTLKILFENYSPGMTQKELASKTGKSLSTIKKYWQKDSFDGDIYYDKEDLVKKMFEEEGTRIYDHPYFTEEYQMYVVQNIFNLITEFDLVMPDWYAEEYKIFCSLDIEQSIAA
jgi:transcriptional regulator with XRE-family HTH domain